MEDPDFQSALAEAQKYLKEPDSIEELLEEFSWEDV